MSAPRIDLPSSRSPITLLSRRNFLRTGFLGAGALVLTGAGTCATGPDGDVDIPYNEDAAKFDWSIIAPTSVRPSMCCGFSADKYSGAGIVQVGIVLDGSGNLLLEGSDTRANGTTGWESWTYLMIPDFVSLAHGQSRGGASFVSSLSDYPGVIANGQYWDKGRIGASPRLTLFGAGVVNFRLYREYSVGPYPKGRFMVIEGTFNCMLEDQGSMQGSFNTPIAYFE